jgi:hypothetical protein
MRKRHLSVFAVCAVLAAPLASADEGDTFFCWWVDAPHKTMATTDIFPGDRSMEKDMAGVFAMDMQARGESRGRVYDCAWRPGPREAADALDNLRATHATNGFKLKTIDWNPMTR